MPTYTQCLDVTLPEGIYDFVVADASDKQSQSGNDMIELQLIIKGPDGQESKVYDNLVFTPKAVLENRRVPPLHGRQAHQGTVCRVRRHGLSRPDRQVRRDCRKYEGRERNKVGEYLDPAVIKDSQSPQQAVKPQPAAKPAVSATSPADDEIPMY